MIATGYFYFDTKDKQGDIITREAIEKLILPEKGSPILFEFDPKNVVGTLISANKNFDQNRLEFTFDIGRGVVGTGFAIAGINKSRTFLRRKVANSIKDFDLVSISVLASLHPVDDRNKIHLHEDKS